MVKEMKLKTTKMLWETGERSMWHKNKNNRHKTEQKARKQGKYYVY